MNKKRQIDSRKDGNVKVTLDIGRYTLARLDERAAEEGRSRAAQIRRMIEAGLEGR